MLFRLFLLFSTCAALGQEIEPRGKHADEIRGEIATISWLREMFAALANDPWVRKGYAHDDLKLAKEAFDAEIKLHEQIAQAFAREDRDEALKLREGVTAARKVWEMWSERVSQARRFQSNYAPEEKWYATEARYTKPAAMHALDGLCQAKRDASTAWGDVAEAMVPGADKRTISEFKDRAYLAEVEAEIAEWRYRWERERVDVISDRIDSPQMQAVLERWKKLQDEKIAIRRAEGERAKRQREVDRALQQIRDEYHRAFMAAREEERKRRERR